MQAAMNRTREHHHERRPAAGSGAIRAHVEHAHHWKIDEAMGQFSTGVCVVCKERRQFRNWIAETDFITAIDYAVGTATTAVAERE